MSFQVNRLAGESRVRKERRGWGEGREWFSFFFFSSGRNELMFCLI